MSPMRLGLGHPRLRVGALQAVPRSRSASRSRCSGAGALRDKRSISAAVGLSRGPTTGPCPLARRLLHERADGRVVRWSPVAQREGRWPHAAVIEARLVAEAEGGITGAELLRALEEADDLAVSGVGGHPVPGLRDEVGRPGLDE